MVKINIFRIRKPKRMIFPKRELFSPRVIKRHAEKGFRLPKFGDMDMDGVPNYRDCRPMNPFLQHIMVKGQKVSSYSERVYDYDELDEDESVLDAPPNYGKEEPVRRFMWSPARDIFVMGGEELHADLLHRHKIADPEYEDLPYDEYVRGIYIKKNGKGRIYTRTYFKPRDPYDEFDESHARANVIKQKQIKSKLHRIGVKEGVEIHTDTTNKMLMHKEGGKFW